MAELFAVYVGDGNEVIAVCSTSNNAQLLRDKINATLPPLAEGVDMAHTGEGVLFNPSHATALARLAEWGYGS